MKAIDVKEVMVLLNIKQSRAYEIIRTLNKELTAQGYYTVSGRVSKDYLMERMYIKRDE